jgi:hypothetical protein
MNPTEPIIPQPDWGSPRDMPEHVLFPDDDEEDYE